VTRAQSPRASHGIRDVVIGGAIVVALVTSYNIYNGAEGFAGMHKLASDLAEKPVGQLVTGRRPVPNPTTRGVPPSEPGSIEHYKVTSTPCRFAPGTDGDPGGITADITITNGTQGRRAYDVAWDVLNTRGAKVGVMTAVAGGVGPGETRQTIGWSVHSLTGQYSTCKIASVKVWDIDTADSKIIVQVTGKAQQ
jgi:hypothetical protein